MTQSGVKFDPSINAYFNALIRETGGWSWHPRQREFVFSHPESCSSLHVPCHFRSLGGRHMLGAGLLLDDGEGPQPIPFREAVAWTLTLPSLRGLSSRVTRESFRYRVQRSEENLQVARAYRTECVSPDDILPRRFIDSEQALVNGHSIHPCPKDRGNMSQEEASAFAPEYAGEFPLIWYSVEAASLQCHESTDSTLDRAVDALLRHESAPIRAAAAEARANGHRVIPCHPFQHRHWQAHPDLKALQANGQLRSLGLGAVPWQATSSLRGIWSDEADWMLKFSLSVRITNSLRHLQPKEAVRGPALADLIRTPPAARWQARHPGFTVLAEPVAAAIRSPAGQPLAETTLVFRTNPFQGADADHCELLASLLQDDPATGLSRLGTCLQARHAGEAGARAWFHAYLEHVVKPLLDAQGNLGLLFGAHQQNLILKLDDDFQPVAAWFRDCQGTGFSALAHQRFGPALKATIADSDNELPDTLAVPLFCYYLFINSTFNVITSLAAAGLCPEQTLWQQLRQWLQQRLAESPADPGALHYLLDSPTLHAKNNFLCSLRALNENTLEDLEAIYHPMPNPLVTIRQAHTRERKTHDAAIFAH
ncbi:IucA/IucC family protein [Marinobacter sp.]|uniref:IucA/IucC family protein n=1 Tax=Marinobacter sp. TaxID=50741 RepID=UPI0035619592